MDIGKDAEIIFQITICTEEVMPDGTIKRIHWASEYVSDLNDLTQKEEVNDKLLDALSKKLKGK